MQLSHTHNYNTQSSLRACHAISSYHLEVVGARRSSWRCIRSPARPPRAPPHYRPRTFARFGPKRCDLGGILRHSIGGICRRSWRSSCCTLRTRRTVCTCWGSGSADPLQVDDGGEECRRELLYIVNCPLKSSSNISLHIPPLKGARQVISRLGCLMYTVRTGQVHRLLSVF